MNQARKNGGQSIRKNFGENLNIQLIKLMGLKSFRRKSPSAFDTECDNGKVQSLKRVGVVVEIKDHIEDVKFDDMAILLVNLPGERKVEINEGIKGVGV